MATCIRIAAICARIAETSTVTRTTVATMATATTATATRRTSRQFSSRIEGRLPASRGEPFFFRERRPRGADRHAARGDREVKVAWVIDTVMPSGPLVALT